jgi:hypothetical protein
MRKTFHADCAEQRTHNKRNSVALFDMEIIVAQCCCLQIGFLQPSNEIKCLLITANNLSFHSLFQHCVAMPTVSC